MAFQTEVEFTLPKGYLDSDGVLHRTGTMRLATAADEILPLKDGRVKQNPAYLTVIVFARVIVKLGALPDVNTKVIENLFASDLNYLQELYEKLNSDDPEEDEAKLRPVASGGEEGWLKEFGVLGEA